MNEYTLQLISFCKLLWIAVFCYLYGLGGIHFKVLRRYVGAGWIAGGIYLFQSWQGNSNPWAYLYPGLLAGSLTLPYGGEGLLKKIGLRAMYGACLAVSAVPLAFISHLWLLWTYHVAICVIACIVFGVWNPFKSARDEESNIASVAITLPMFMV